MYDGRVLGVISDEDARAAGWPRPELARQVRERLVEVVTSTREEFSAWSIAVGLAWGALATTASAALLWLLARIYRRVQSHVGSWYRRLTADPRVGRTAAARATGLESILHSGIFVVAAAVAAALIAVWVELVLHVLPWSRPLARLIYGYVSEPLRTLWLGLLGYVPNLFYLAIIAVTTFVVLRIVRFVFKEIEVGNIRLASFPDDWAEPTYKLVRTLLLAVAFVGAFPYIPGSQTPAFQGISLFLGLLVSLSSSSALSNIIAGTILTYTRAFRVGDIVRIGETFGEVTVKRLLATHMRTYKNVVVSIPNSLILTTQVLNYTTLAAERGLVAHSSVTIGYDAPWRRVHELLIAAALRTEGVLTDPPPYVLQTALNDFSVSYEINAVRELARPAGSHLLGPAREHPGGIQRGGRGDHVAQLFRAPRRQPGDDAEAASAGGLCGAGVPGASPGGSRRRRLKPGQGHDARTFSALDAGLISSLQTSLQPRTHRASGRPRRWPQSGSRPGSHAP